VQSVSWLNCVGGCLNFNKYLCLIDIRHVERLVWTNKMVAILDAVLVTMETARMPNVYPR